MGRREDIFKVKELRDIRDEMQRSDTAQRELLYEAFVEAADRGYRVDAEPAEGFVSREPEQAGRAAGQSVSRAGKSSTRQPVTANQDPEGWVDES